ncbi:hypothetical protein Tco_1383583, partial [Tanacetum coccineum]
GIVKLPVKTLQPPLQVFGAAAWGIVRNTIELLEGNNVVPLRSDTIWLVQNECSFHELRSEDPNQHLKDFLKLMDSLDLDGANRERTPSWRISLRSMDSFQGLTPKILSSWHRSLAPKDLTLYDNESWNDPRDFTKLVKAISLPQDVPSTSERCLIELENQVQFLMEAHIALRQPTKVNKITSSCEICSGPHDTQYCIKNPKQAFVEYASSRTDEAGEFVYTKRDDGEVMFIEIVKKNDDSRKEEPEARGLEIMRRKLDPREDSDRGVSNFTGRIKEMHVFVGNFTYATDFMIVEDISSIIDPRLSHIVQGKPFVEISNMTHDPPEGVVRFTNRTDEIAYKMPHKIEQYNSLSDLGKEHTKSVYLRNKKDKRRGMELYLTRRSLEVLRKFHWTILGGGFNQLSHVSSPLLSKPWEY